MINDPSVDLGDALLKVFEEQAREEMAATPLAPVTVVPEAEEESLVVKYQFGDDIVQVKVTGFTNPLHSLSALQSAGSPETIDHLAAGLVQALEDLDV